jgi:hypothetical protein
MDARKKRLGEHAADSAPPWAASALGPVPEHPAAQLDWQHRAASIAAWRELSGYHHPADPIGPESAAAAPDLRAAADADAARRRGDHRQATREQERARSYRALEEAYRQRETVFAAVMTDRAEWEAATRQQRQLAVAADAELRRRHPASTSRRCGRPSPGRPPAPSVPGSR